MIHALGDGEEHDGRRGQRDMQATNHRPRRAGDPFEHTDRRDAGERDGGHEQREVEQFVDEGLVHAPDELTRSAPTLSA